MTHAFNAPPLQIPDGRYATLSDMEEFGNTLQAFIRRQEANLEQVYDDARHNEIVDFLEVLALNYNEQLGIFKQMELTRRQRLFANITQLTLLRPPG